jgi:hypothetical protein
MGLKLNTFDNKLVLYIQYRQVKQMHTFSCIMIFAVPTILLVMNTMWFAKILRGLKKTLAKME